MGTVAEQPERSRRKHGLRRPRSRAAFGQYISHHFGITAITHWDWTVATAVDDLNDGVRVVVEVRGQGGISQVITIGGLKSREVVRDLRRVTVAHAC